MFKVMVTNLRTVDKQRDAEFLQPVTAPLLMTHRDIANILGIGRAHVYFHEQAALRKMRDAMSDVEIRSLDALDCLSADDFRRFIESFPEDRSRSSERYSAQHGWLSVSRVVSSNGGSEDIVDVARAFQFLKRDHQTEVRPPVLLNTSEGVRVSYRIEAVAAYDGDLRIRCWPGTERPRSVERLREHRCTAVVDSVFDEDADGSFDIPILVCAIVSTDSA